MRSTCIALLCLGFVLSMTACDPALTLEAKAGCGEATPEESREGPEHLPGRECISCHRGFSAAGTVFESLDSSCDTGVEGATVEILDMDHNLVFSMTTNAVGNFYTKRRLPSPYYARVIGPDGQMTEKPDSLSEGNCSRCHRIQPVEKARGRVQFTSPTPPRDAGTNDAATGTVE